MAKRRCFHIDVFQSEKFLDLSNEAKTLYTYFNLNADDDGFVINPKTVMRLIGIKEDSLNELILSGFIMMFNDSIYLVTHWWKHNTKQNDRYNRTEHSEILIQLAINEKKEYVLCYQNVDSLETQDNINEYNSIKMNTNKENTNQNKIAEVNVVLDNEKYRALFNSE